MTPDHIGDDFDELDAHLCRATAEQAGKVEGESGWMLDGDLIYKLSGGIVPCNTHEIRVTQWDGSRALADCDAAAAVLFQQLAKPTQPAATQMPVAWFTEDRETDRSATTYDPVVAARWRAKGWPVGALFDGPAAPVSPSREVEAMREVVAFLLGEGTLNDRWFGDDAALPLVAGKYPARYWWRTPLRAAFDSISPVQEKAP